MVNVTWQNKQEWQLHIDNKEYMRKTLEVLMSDTDFYKKIPTLVGLIKFIKIDDGIINVYKGQHVRTNYSFMIHLYKNYISSYKKIKTPLLMKALIKAGGLDITWRIILFLFREDTAYNDKIGACIQFIITNPELFQGKNKFVGLIMLKYWWKMNDYRERSRNWIESVFKFMIERYKNDEFIKGSIDLVIESIFKYKDNWVYDPLYHPDRWYPLGVGQVNYVVAREDIVNFGYRGMCIERINNHG